ncbi:gliotoxin biosynthesis protein [Colletotrichum plurivorum]|uniref:gamma-glutamylcyclotransferase n=1 Tax=Colletotrichum plurivorum TaxID=2175906 RepID=A0A8H6K0M6_9PEZI|nr:gliotoxin biosynthesis protein [Colletotrichum plurivorum]
MEAPSCALILRRIHEATFPPRAPAPRSSVPRTSPSRLAAASPDTNTNTDNAATPNTVLYLAYGSNLSAETFLGARGIRPVSQVNVSAPSLRLVFDLPGLPYREPCFANTAPRKVPKIPDEPPRFPPIPPPPSPPGVTGNGNGSNGWDKGLYGVVYEVTAQDYATIIATERGSSPYADILVPCIPLPARVTVPEKPPIDIPRPFLAHTLYAPSVPDIPDDNNPSTSSQTSSDKIKWYHRLLLPPRRPDPSYAQPSPRYLKLITDGAAEHELPEDYQLYLRSLQPYVPTTTGQKIARAVLTLCFMPIMVLYFAVGKALAGRDGKLPGWVDTALAVVFNLLWIVYDSVLKRVFGDGERTVEDSDGGRRRRFWRDVRVGTDEEKVGLLEGMH